jgi:hypothetical protein
MAEFGRQAERFHAPLEPLDTAERTVGCRHTSPDVCGRHSLDTVCAFARADGMCLAPPMTWPKQFQNLLRHTNPGRVDR